MYVSKVFSLALANAEHLRAADGADALGGRLAIFHGDSLGIAHFSLSAALYTVSLHCFLLPSKLFAIHNKPNLRSCQEGIKNERREIGTQECKFNIAGWHLAQKSYFKLSNEMVKSSEYR